MMRRIKRTGLGRGHRDENTHGQAVAAFLGEQPYLANNISLRLIKTGSKLRETDLSCKNTLK